MWLDVERPDLRDKLAGLLIDGFAFPDGPAFLTMLAPLKLRNTHEFFAHNL